MGVRKWERSVRVRSRILYADRESGTEAGMEASSDEAVRGERVSVYVAARCALFLMDS